QPLAFHVRCERSHQRLNDAALDVYHVRRAAKNRGRSEYISGIDVDAGHTRDRKVVEMDELRPARMIFDERAAADVVVAPADDPFLCRSLQQGEKRIIRSDRDAE